MFRRVRRRLAGESRRRKDGLRRLPLTLEALEQRRLLSNSTYVVDLTDDTTAAGTLRSAILAANADPNPATFDIEFNIPASTSADLTVPFEGFDPITQTWRITLNSPLPVITHSVTIDGYSQAYNALPYRYPDESSSAVQLLAINGLATGGTFTLTTSAPLPVATVTIPYDATAAEVQSTLESVIGVGNVAVSGGPLPEGSMLLGFQGADTAIAIPNLIADSTNLTAASGTNVDVETETAGGTPLTPTMISSVPNSVAAINGDNAQVRVIIDGSTAGVATGLDLDASDSIIRGLAVQGCGVGISVPNPDDVGDLIQGNFIGDLLTYPVDGQTGAPLPTPETVGLAGPANTQEGILLGSDNATVGGLDPDEANVICGNGAQGVLIEPGASGNQVLGNQIGVAGPSTDGLYFRAGNGAEGVLIESSGTSGNPSSIVYASSNVIGGAAPGAGNIISANQSYGIHIVGVGATRNLVEANYIGVAPGGGYILGTGNPGNLADGVRIDDAPDNQIGGPTGSDGNVISSNQGAGVYITGADADGNTVLDNIIGLTSSGGTVLGNDEAGVADYSPGTSIGPGNVISANLIGVFISGASATGVVVRDNLIGTDSSGIADLGNAEDGVEIDNASGVIVLGDSQGPQVISGNLIGVDIEGLTSTGNLVEGNLIGTDRSGTADRGNSEEGVLIEGAPGNTIGGTIAASLNVISANQFGIRIDGSTATGNLIEGNDVGTSLGGISPLGNEVNGIIISNNASQNTIGGSGGGQGNTIAYNVAAGISVGPGTGDSILSNSMLENGQQGIVLVNNGNDSQTAPVVTGVSGGGTGSNVEGSLASVPDTTFLVQFFSSQVADPSGQGQGQTYLGSTTVTTGPSGNVSINFNLLSGLATGSWLTATATNQANGDTSAFSNSLAAQPSSVAFSMASITVSSTGLAATIDVQRSGNQNVSVSVSYATSNGSAVAGQDYTAQAGTLTFPPGQTDETFIVPILANPNRSTSFSTVTLTLSQPVGGVTLGAISSSTLIITNNTSLNVLTFVVDNTADSGPGTLRQAIMDADADPNPGVDNIVFDIPTSTAPNVNVPVPGFDPSTQTWQITPASPLPAITHAVSIDGYTQASIPVAYRYPDQVSSAVQQLILGGAPTGGSFNLTTSAPLPAGTTPPIPYTATALDIQTALIAILGAGNVTVTESVPGIFSVAFQGSDGETAIPNLIVIDELTGGFNPTISVQTTTVGGVPIGNPTLISSVPNAVAATSGEDAQVRVVINGSQTSGATGIVLSASHSILRGLVVEGFGVGISVPSPNISGDLIQGNFIGEYLAYPVDTETGQPLSAPDTVALAGLGNTQQGIVLGSSNVTVGGTEAQDANVICGNGAQGVLIEPGASGNEVLGNQIGVAGPSSTGFYFQAGNGAEGVLIQSTGTATNPSSIVYASSNVIGGAASGAGNIISANHSYGVHIVGVGATRNLVEANEIGAAPGGGFLFGSAQPGNLADGVRIDDAPDNQIGGPVTTDGNVISSNQGAGVYITGGDASGNTVLSNFIGLAGAGSAALGNDQAGVADYAPGTLIGPGNVISANLMGVLVSGASATGVVIRDNLIGTDSSGIADLGNAEDGVEIDNASGVTVLGDSQGPQVISANLIGVEIDGSTSTGNLVEGNLIGTDKSGTADRGNADEGVLIEGAFGNTVGGTTSAALNVISANQWGIRLDGSTATGNVIEGNDVGTGLGGTTPLGNEVNGIIISNHASQNTIGGTGGAQGNTIAYNVAAGVSVQSGTGNSILSNSIFSNGHLGIDLVAPGDPPSGVTPDQPGVRSGPNDLQNDPVVTAVVGGATGSVQAALSSLPATGFLIQFFSNTAPDPSGYGQGQTLIGSQPITTNSSGNATAKLDPPDGVPTNVWISATATNESTGDTSEFSADVIAQPVSVQFAVASDVVNSTAGVATIVVDRLGNSNAGVSVNYATSNGTAIAGKQYLPASGTLTFLPGQSNSQQTFNITILPDTSQSTGAPTVNLALNQPGGGATLGTLSTATLTIDEVAGSGGSGPGGSGSGSTPINSQSPSVISEQVILSGRAIAAIVFGFNKPLDAERAQNLGNYGYYVYSAGANGVFAAAGEGYAALNSAVYNPAADSVTVTPSAPLRLNTFFRITIDGQTNPLLNNGVTDSSGNLLNGSSGTTGSPFVATFGVGTRLKYADGSGNIVTLQLSKGGLMEMSRSLNGAVQQLQLIGTIARKSTLSGSVSRAQGSTGRTLLPPIGGAAGVRIRLKPPAFVFKPTSLVAAAKLSGAKSAAVTRLVTMTHRPFLKKRSPH
jgi:hypothetical protein